jgi:hypothetical protein
MKCLYCNRVTQHDMVQYNNFINTEAIKIPSQPLSLHQQIPLDALHSWQQDVRHYGSLHLLGECLHSTEWEFALFASQHEKKPAEEASAFPCQEGWYLHPTKDNILILL